MKWSLPVFIIPIVVVIVLSIGWGFYEYKNLDFEEPVPGVLEQRGALWE